MNAGSCAREQELLDALGRGFVGAELLAHLDECGSCAELHLVAGALLDDRGEAIAHAALPSPGTVWWRMQLRLRQEMQAATRRALFIGQAVTLVVAIVVAAWLFGKDMAMYVRQVIVSTHLSTPVLIALATWIVLAPIGGYVAIRQK